MSPRTCQISHCDRTAPTGLCRTHRNELDTALSRTLDDLHQLADEHIRDVRHTSTTTSSSSTTDQAIPYNPAASAARQRAITTIRNWQALIADQLGEPVRFIDDTRPITYIRDAIRAGRLDQWHRLGHLLNDLARIGKTTRELTDNPPERIWVGYCDNLTGPDQTPCGARLMANDDDTTTDCPRCGATHFTEDGKARLTRSMPDQLVTASHAATLIRLDRGKQHDTARLVDRIRKWRDSKLLATRGSTTDRFNQARDLYRYGDIVDLLERIDTTRRPGRRAQTER